MKKLILILFASLHTITSALAVGDAAPEIRLGDTASWRYGDGKIETQIVTGLDPEKHQYTASYKNGDDSGKGPVWAPGWPFDVKYVKNNPFNWTSGDCEPSDRPYSISRDREAYTKEDVVVGAGTFKNACHYHVDYENGGSLDLYTADVPFLILKLDLKLNNRDTSYYSRERIL